MLCREQLEEHQPGPPQGLHHRCACCCLTRDAGDVRGTAGGLGKQMLPYKKEVWMCLRGQDTCGWVREHRLEGKEKVTWLEQSNDAYCYVYDESW